MRFNLPAKGFTLIEMIIGILVFAVAMTMMFSVVIPRSQESIDPIYQVRAAKLANSLLGEIRGKAFDENSNPSLGLGPCGENGSNCSVVLGPETGENRDSFNDVDDYDGFDIDGLLLSQSSISYNSLYANYKLLVTVIYDGDYNGIADSLINAKLITVTVTMPNSEKVEFASYRSNY